MAEIQSQRYCTNCGERTLHRKTKTISDGMGILLTILTGGFFLLLWVPCGIINLFCRAHCQKCGAKNY